MEKANKKINSKNIARHFQGIPSKALSSNLSFKLAAALLTITILGIIATAGDVIVEEGDLNVSNDLIADTNTLYVDSNNNRVGIGTTSPTALFDINPGGSEATAKRARIQANTDSVALYVQQDGSGDVFQTSNNFIIKSSGNVGIGTTSPGAPLEIYGPNFPVFRATRTTTTGTTGLWSSFALNTKTTGDMADTFGSGFLFYIQDPGATEYLAGIYAERDGGDTYGNLHFYTRNGANWDKRLTIKKTGNIGIGTTTPTYPLEVSGNVSGISIYASNNISATRIYNKNFCV